MFYDALAWTAITLWALRALYYIVVYQTTTNPQVYLAVRQYAQKTSGLWFISMVVAVLWLVFG
jgi:hypothetical protein